MTPATLLRYVNRFAGRRIAVAGDFMLDHFIWGQAGRLAAEAPVPVIEIANETYVPGGAGNVARNLNELGARVFPFGLAGRDAAGQILRREFATSGIPVEGLIAAPNRPTTRKVRIIETARKHQVARADQEHTDPAPVRVIEKLAEMLLAGRFAAVIISDYDKGVVTPEFLGLVLPRLRRTGVPVFLDPRPRHAAHYKPVTVITPNRKEAEQISGFAIDDSVSLRQAGRRILEMTEGEAVLITLGDQGMALVERSGGLHRIETLAREVYDVTGAGDTVIATTALAAAAGAPLPAAAQLANCAAGIVVAHVGTAAPTLAELRDAIRRSL